MRGNGACRKHNIQSLSRQPSSLPVLEDAAEFLDGT